MRNSYFEEVTEAFFLGIINDIFLGLPAGSTPLLFIILYPLSKVVKNNLYVERKTVLVILATGHTLILALGYYILPGAGAFTSTGNVILKTLLNGIWAPVLFSLSTKTYETLRKKKGKL